MKIIKALLLFLILAVLLGRFVEVESLPVEVPDRKLVCAEGEVMKPATDQDLPTCKTLEAINVEYLAQIKPIFDAKCNMCHGAVGKMPLYTRYPIVRSWVEEHIEDGIDDMDFRYDFPFRADGTVKKHRGRLGEIAETLQKGDMPPLNYLVVHWNSRLTEEETATIKAWVKKSREMLKPEVASAAPAVPATPEPVKP